MYNSTKNIYFSIIIPTYNRSLALNRCLNSLVNQTFKDFEVLICDDGSTDNTSDVVDRFKHHLDIKYFYDENWGGPARPRNRGIKHSNGEFICFLDSDDWWYPQKLEECFKYTSDYDLIYHSLDIVKPKKKQYLKRKVGREISDNALKYLIINGNCIPNSSVSIRKEIIDHIGVISEDRSLISMEDYDYWLRVAQYTNKFKFIDVALGGYLWDTDDNISEISLKRIENEKYIFEKNLTLLDETDRIQAQEVFSYKLGRYYGKIGLYSESIKQLKKALSNKSVILKGKSILFYFGYLFRYLFMQKAR